MIIKYDTDFSLESIQMHFKKIINQIYKLLPMREEGNDWIKPLETIMEELAGMNRLLVNQEQYDAATFLTLFCKLEGLFTLTEEKDFSLYRRTIFECLGLLNSIKENGIEFK